MRHRFCTPLIALVCPDNPLTEPGSKTEGQQQKGNVQALWTAKGLSAVAFVSALLVLPAVAGTPGDDVTSTQAQSAQGGSDKMQLSLMGTESHANQGNNTSCEIKDCGPIGVSLIPFATRLGVEISLHKARDLDVGSPPFDSQWAAAAICAPRTLPSPWRPRST